MHAVAGGAIDAATRWMNSLYAIVRIGSLSDQTAPLVTVSRCGIVIRILVGISVVDVSVVRVPPIRKTERNEIKIAEEMAMMAFVVISGIPMAPKVAIPETAIISATRKSTRGRYPHPAEYWTKATAG